MKKIFYNLKPKTPARLASQREAGRQNLIKGVFLIESIVAMTVIIFGLLSAMSLVSRSLSLNRVIADKYIAANLAAEGVEIIKGVIDGNVLQELAFNLDLAPGNYVLDYKLLSSNNPLLYDTNDGYNYTTGNPTLFNRVIKIENITDSNGIIIGLKVNSIVTWISRGGNFDINVEDHFYDWQ